MSGTSIREALSTAAMWATIKRAWKQQRTARDYLMMLAGRYGRRPPQEQSEALTLLALRIWEIHNPPERDLFAEACEGLSTASRERETEFALETINAFAAVAGYMASLAGDDPLAPEALLNVWYADPWTADRVICEAANERRGALFRLAFTFGFETPENLAEMVDHLDRCA